LRKVSSILDCQPSPVALKCLITSGLSRSDTSFFVGALFGPRPFRIEAARSGKASENGLARAKSAFVSSGLSLTSRKSFWLKPVFLLAFGILFPFVLAGGAHADDA